MENTPLGYPSDFPLVRRRRERGAGELPVPKPLGKGGFAESRWHVPRQSVSGASCGVFIRGGDYLSAQLKEKFAMCIPMCNSTHMATNIQLDEELISEAQRLGKHQSKRATVEDALREYVQHRKQLEILQSFGKIDYTEDYNYKAARQRK